jgi:hypothetical protein
LRRIDDAALAREAGRGALGEDALKSGDERGRHA